jgi:hypothetical protein
MKDGARGATMDIVLLLFPVAVLLKLGLPNYPLTITLFLGLAAASGLWAIRPPDRAHARAVKRPKR